MFGRATKLITGELPPKAAEKFQHIADEARDARAVAKGVGEDHQRAVAEHQYAQRQFEALKSRGDAQPAEYDRAQKEVAAARAPREREQVRLDRATEAAAGPTELRRNLEAWLDTVSSFALKDVTTAEPKLRKGESVADAIERCRRVVRELRAEARNVRAAPIPSSEAKMIMRRYVDALGEASAPSIHHVIEAGVPRIDWPNDDLIAVADQFGQGQFARPEALPAVALMAWAQPDVLYAALCRDVDAESDDAAALSAADRFKRQATIAADRLANEREEEFWIQHARLSAVPIARRPDADPRAVLGLSGDLPAPADSF